MLKAFRKFAMNDFRKNQTKYIISYCDAEALKCTSIYDRFINTRYCSVLFFKLQFNCPVILRNGPES